ncbi:MAG: hypothetical protein HQM13_16500 [SAR324 cluster bacterium]|nr:hypothetical protein [SAR324 cluster bacterium]
MKYAAIFITGILVLVGCTSTERKEIRRRTPNFVAVESDAPQTAKKTKRLSRVNHQLRVVAPAKTKKDEQWISYAVTQGTMLILDGGKQTFVPFQAGPLNKELVRQIMEIDDRHFELFGGFEGYLNGNEVTITSKDVYDQKPIYKWITSENTRYAVEIPEVAQNRFNNGKFKYVALEIANIKNPEKKYYFHVDPRNIARPLVVFRDDAKVQRVVMGNSDELNQTINQNLWINEPPKQTGPQIAIPGDTSPRSIQVLHLVRLYFSPQESEFFDPKYEVQEVKKSETDKKNLILAGRFTGEGVITGKFEKGSRSEIFDANSTVQYHFKQNALTAGRGGIQDKPTRMEIEFFTLKLGQDEDQLRLAMQQAQYKSQQQLNVYFTNNGKRLSEIADFNFSLKRVDDAAKLAQIKQQKLRPNQPDGSFTTPHHLASAVLELDLKAAKKIIR